jgi:hypothetical protein
MLQKTPGNYRDKGGVAMFDGMKSMRDMRQNRFARGIFMAGIAITTIASAADASAVPFYYASASAVEPQIATLIVGANQNIGQAIVSPDRKFVTLDMDPRLLGNASIQSFTYQHGGAGFVGSTPGPARSGSDFRDSLTPSIALTPAEIAPTISVLDTPGMVLIAPLER